MGKQGLAIPALGDGVGFQGNRDISRLHLRNTENWGVSKNFFFFFFLKTLILTFSTLQHCTLHGSTNDVLYDIASDNMYIYIFS